MTIIIGYFILFVKLKNYNYLASGDNFVENAEIYSYNFSWIHLIVEIPL